MTVQEKLKLLKEGFTKEQVEEIRLGEEQFLDTSFYAKKEYLALQMKEIRLGMEHGLEIELYARPAFDWLQMGEIRLGLESEVDVKKYANHLIPHDTMREIRLGLESDVDLSKFVSYKAEIIKEIRLATLKGIDITPYAKKKFDAEQLEQIRLAMEHRVDIEPYIDEHYRGISLQEIRIGLERRVDVRNYANIVYNWRQMREIRLGLEHQVQVAEYTNPMYDWKQMQEIRIGLEEGLNVDYFKNLMYTAREMKRRRRYMFENMSDEFMGKDAPVVVNEAMYIIKLSNDKFSATLKMDEWDKSANFKGIIKLLRDHNIIYGIKEDMVKRVVTGEFVGEEVVIAEGKRPQKGKDGWYEFFFRTSFSKEPAELEDGSLDYTNIDWFEQVTKGQKLAVYHDAGEGEEGCTVTGQTVRTTRGKPLPVLRGKGIKIDEDNVTYLADVSGYVEYVERDRKLEVHNLLILPEVTPLQGRIVFDGDVNVKGNVAEGAYVEATGDIVIDGMVEAAVVKAEGDIVIRKGVNGAAKGTIISKKNISVNFLEYARVWSTGDIKANYFLNSTVNCGGKVTISGNQGSIIGGTTYAAKEIKVHTLGNDVMVKTQLRLGLDQEMIERQESIEKQIRNIIAELNSLNGVMQQLQETLKAEERNENDMYLKVENAILSKTENRKRLEEELDESKAKIEETLKARAIIDGEVFENVSIIINDKEWRCRNGAGPTTVQILNDELRVASR